MHGLPTATELLGINAYYDEVSEINVSHLSGVIVEMNDVVSLAKSMSTVDASKIEKTASDMCQTFLKAAQKTKGVFKTVAIALMTEFLSGLSKDAEKPSKILLDAVASAIRSIRAEWQTFYSAGQYLVDGFCDGITTNTYRTGL